MSEPSLFLWAESSKSGASYHPLWAHTMDVFHVFSFINKNKGGKYDRDLAFLASMHDLGKATPCFQEKNALLFNKLIRTGTREAGGNNRAQAPPIELIGVAALFEIFEEIKSPSQKRKLRELALYVGMHRGFPYKKSEANDLLKSGADLLGGPPWKAIRKSLYNRLEELLNVYPDEANIRIDSWEMTPFAGMVAFSDWIASDRAHFPFVDGDITPEEYLPLSRLRAEKAVSNKGFSPTPVIMESSYKNIFDADPGALQAEVEEMPVGDEPTLTIIESPSGEGRLDAALFLAARIRRKKRAGIFLAAPVGPFREALFERFTKFINRAADPGQPSLNDIAIITCSRIAELVDTFKSFEPGPDEEEIGSEESGINWFMLKNRSLVAPFGMGSFEQIYLSAFNARYYFLRLFGLAGKTVIFDCVAAYDAYIRPLLLRTLEWLRAAGADVIALSDVLPEAFVKDLAKAWGVPNFEPAAGYPKLISAQGEKAVQKTFQPNEEKNIKIILYPDNFGDAVRRARELAGEGASVAIILNSVKRAQKFYKLLSSDGGSGSEIQVELYHTGFVERDREELEKRLITGYGKDAERGRGRILVSDPSLELALELDFDCVFTDVAPIDLLIRRSGNLHRFARVRDAESQEPVLRILAPDVRVEGLGALYEYSPDYSQLFIYRTIAALEAKREWNFPKDYRPLVEAVYAPVPPLASEELGNFPCHEDRSAIKKALRDLDFERTKARTKANSSLLPPPSDIWEYFDFGRFLQKEENEAREDMVELTAKGRRAESVQPTILLYKKSGEYYLDPSFTVKVAPGMELDGDGLSGLLRNRIGISEHFLIERLVREAHESPFGQNEPPAMLRDYKYLILDEDRFYVGRDHVVKYDKAMGLVVEEILKCV